MADTTVFGLTSVSKMQNNEELMNIDNLRIDCVLKELKARKREERQWSMKEIDEPCGGQFDLLKMPETCIISKKSTCLNNPLSDRWKVWL